MLKSVCKIVAKSIVQRFCDDFAASLLHEISIRYNAGYSQEKLCAELQLMGCDIGRTTYEKYENGQLNIRISVIIALKKIYNCSYEEFFVGLEQSGVSQ